MKRLEFHNDGYWKGLRLSAGSFVIWSPEVVWLRMGDKSLMGRNPLTRARKLFKRIRHALLPSFWAIGLYSCDFHNPNIAHRHYRAWAWGLRSIQRLESDGSAASDGPCSMFEISLYEYVKGGDE